MDLNSLRAAIEEHSVSLSEFADCQPSTDSESEIEELLDVKLNSKRWRDSGHSFASVAADGCGGQFVAWCKPGETDTPIVYLGSEGEWGVVAARPPGFLQWAAHSAGARYLSPYSEPAFVEWAEDEGILRAILDDGDEVEKQAALAAQAAFREALGLEVRPLPSLNAELEPLRREFQAWVTRFYESL
jgi:hypothetical protein